MNSIKRKTISFKYYIPLYLIFISLLLLATRDFEAAKSSAVDITNIHRLISIPLSIFISLYILSKQTKVRSKFPLPLRLFSLYWFVGIISAFFYSNWLGYSLWKILEITADLVLFFYSWSLLNKFPNILEEFFNKIILFFKILLLSVLASIVVMPNLAIRPPTAYGDAFLPYQIFGTIIQLNANSIGMISAIILYVSLTKLIDKRPKNILSFNLFWIILSSIFVIFAQSRTSIAAFSIVFVLFIFFTKKLNVITKIIIVIICILFILYFINDINLYLHRGLSDQQLENLSGRKIWWETALQTFLSSDILNQMVGLGYATGNRMILLQFGDGSASTLHSDYMDSLISTGYLGFLALTNMVLITFIHILKNIIRFRSNLFFTQLVGIYALLTIRSFTGTTFATHNIFILLYFMTILNIYFMTQRRKQ